MLLVFTLLWFIIKHYQADWRRSFLTAAVVWGVLLTLITEVLSLFHALTQWGLISAWGGCALGLIMYLYRFRPPVWAPVWAPVWSRFRTLSGTENRFNGIILLSMGIIALITAATALSAPPNTWDSMTYHMSRIAHWAQNKSVQHYPASDLRQLYQHPWAEFAITHAQIITGDDRFANMVQWFSMVGSVIGVSAIVALWTADKRTQLLAAVLCITIPMGILQASGSQNDYVTAFWLVCLAYWIMMVSMRPYQHYFGVMVGASLGLMILTKATTYIYATPFMLWFVWLLWQRQQFATIRHFLSIIVLLLTIVGPIVGPHFIRNMQVFGSPLGPHAESYTNDVFYPQAIASNVIRNTALHIVLPDNLRAPLIDALNMAHHVLNIDINDPRTTFPEQVFALPSWTMHEDLAPSPVHLGLVMLCMIFSGVYVIRGYSSGEKNTPDYTQMMYFISVIAAYGLFNLILRWQPWNARLHLPFWVILAPIIAIYLPKKAQLAVIFMLLISAIFPLTMNANRALLGDENNLLNTGRSTLYFAGMPAGSQAIYETAVTQIIASGCKQIGLAIGSEGEYPIWVLLKGYAEHIEHINTPVLQSDFIPCAIIGASNITGEGLIVHDSLYLRVWRDGVLAVFLPE